MRVISYYWIHPDDGMPQIDKTERSKESSEEKRRRFYVTDKRRKNMKNSNLFKKFAVMVVSAMMVITSFAMPTFAAADSQVTIKGVEEPKAVVTLYKVVKEVDGKWALQDDTKKVGPDVASVTEGDTTVVTVGGIKTTTKTTGGQSIVTVDVVPGAAEISAIAKNPGNLPVFETKRVGNDYVSYTTNEGDNKKPLEPGVYVAVVSGDTGDTLYNPMVVSIDYNDTNKNNEVSAGSDFVVGNDTAYAKKSTPEMKKTTLDAENRYSNPAKNENPFVDGFDTPANDRNVGTDFAGAVIPYKVVATIPSYADTYTNPRFFFKDALQKGFAGYVKYSDTDEIIVYEEDAEQTSGYRKLTLGQDYKFVKVTDTGIDKTDNNAVAANYKFEGQQSFALEFTVNKNDPSRKVCIVYKAQLVGKDHADYMAGINPYTNEAYIEWSKNPSDEDEYGKDDDCTHHYTFDIDGNIGGDDQGEEIIKVGVDEAGKLITSEQELKTNWEPLENAEFKIFKQNEDGDDVEGDALQTVLTNDKGQMPFRGLDAGKYFIKETKAPAGYALNETLIPVEIAPTFTAKTHHGKTCHIMTSYTITINGYSNTYTLNDDGTIANTNNKSDFTVDATRTQNNLAVADETDEYNSFTAGFVNTKTGTLPSTGGIGTVVFTVGGIAIMALALFLLFGAKKKEQE